MSRKLMTVVAAALLLVLLLAPAIAFAHQTIQVNGYDVEYGWLNEPVIVGQANAIVLNISKPEAAAEAGAMDMGAVSLSAPADGAVVQGDHVDVVAEFSGLSDTAESDGTHWHLMVDGQSISMVPLHQTSVTITGLGDGEHTLEASLADASHDVLGVAAKAKITVTGGAATNAPAASGVEALDTGHDHPVIAMADVDVSNLKIEVTYGGETKTLSLQPLGEDTPGQFVAPLTPTRAGQFTVRLSGKIDQTDITLVEVQPEEVQSADVVAFPKAAEAEESDSEGLGLAGWLGIGGIVLGLAGVVLGGLALARRK
jgi:hypothetical protein